MHHRFRSLCVLRLVALAAALAACSGDAVVVPIETEIAGTVLDFDGEPVADAVVFVPSDPATASTYGVQRAQLALGRQEPSEAFVTATSTDAS